MGEDTGFRDHPGAVTRLLGISSAPLPGLPTFGPRLFSVSLRRAVGFFRLPDAPMSRLPDLEVLLPLPMYPTASQPIPDWRGFARFHPNAPSGVPAFPITGSRAITRSPDLESALCAAPLPPFIPPHPSPSQFGVSLSDVIPIHPTLAYTSAMSPSFGVGFSMPCLCSFSQKLVARKLAPSFVKDRSIHQFFALERISNFTICSLLCQA